MHSDRVIIIQRHLRAPRDLVFEAWTRPAALATWWGPAGFSTRVQALELAVGGRLLLTMVGPDGTEYPNEIVYDEILAPERLRYHHLGELGFETVVTFEAQQGGTLLTMTGTFPSAEACKRAVEQFKAEEGGHQTVQRLAAHLEALDGEDIVLERLVLAPLARVWQAWTDPKQLGSWWGPKGYSVGVVSHDLRVGGIFHYWMDPPGQPRSYGRFEYRDVRPMEHLAWINAFATESGGLSRPDFWPEWPQEIYNSVSFIEEGPHTRLLLRGRPIRESAAERSFYLQVKGGVTQGYGGTIDQLCEMVEAG
jgi:uncharacterized protein YndB with AHSA1/START domain